MTTDNYLFLSKRVDDIRLETPFYWDVICVCKNQMILHIATHIFTDVKMQLRHLTVKKMLQLLPRFLWEIPSYYHGSGLSQISQTCVSQKRS